MARHHALLAKAYLLRAEAAALEAEAAIQRPDHDADLRAAAAAALLEDADLFRRCAGRHARLAQGLPEHDLAPDFDDVLARCPECTTGSVVPGALVCAGCAARDSKIPGVVPGVGAALGPRTPTPRKAAPTVSPAR